MTETCFHTLPDGNRIAYRHVPGAGPTLVFLPGYMSDMAGGKAQAAFARAAAPQDETTPTLILYGRAACRFAGPAFGCPAACGLVFAMVFVLLNTLADVLVILVNPRLRHKR